MGNPEEWVEILKQCKYLPEQDLKELCEMVNPLIPSIIQLNGVVLVVGGGEWTRVVWEINRMEIEGRRRKKKERRLILITFGLPLSLHPKR
jgi:hypothetical protein